MLLHPQGGGASCQTFSPRHPFFRKMHSENSYAFVLGSGTSLIPLLPAAFADPVASRGAEYDCLQRRQASIRLLVGLWV